MKVTIDRNLCGAWAPACEECFSVFVARGYAPDRACITEAEENGSDTLTAAVLSGEFEGTFKIEPQDREKVMREGFIKFCTLPEEAYDIKPPHGQDIRAKQSES